MNLDLDVEEILALKAEFVFHWEAQFKVVLYSESSQSAGNRRLCYFRSFCNYLFPICKGFEHHRERCFIQFHPFQIRDVSAVLMINYTYCTKLAWSGCVTFQLTQCFSLQMLSSLSFLTSHLCETILEPDLNECNDLQKCRFSDLRLASTQVACRRTVGFGRPQIQCSLCGMHIFYLCTLGHCNTMKVSAYAHNMQTWHNLVTFCGIHKFIF